ncbi:MAG: tetratricopeptide repeat protein, partial [candidate division KSB1 bacterium]|nr:tetratricopeptide repeat protein [candidate division KSB1 bacterium]
HLNPDERCLFVRPRLRDADLPRRGRSEAGRPFERHPRTGIVGPMSDNVSGPQQVPNVSCLTEREVETFAARWAVEHAGQDIPITRLVGFCLLARKEVIDRIGGLDEQFGSGGFDDDDLCVRVALAGYEARIAQDVFIHHTGGGVLRREGDSKYSHNLRRNWELFKAKWGIPTDTPYEKGYYRLNLKSLDTSQLYLPLPDVSADHHPEADGRWWQDISGNGQKPRTKQGGAREDLADVQEMVNQLLAPGQKALDQGQLEAAAREFTQVTEHYPELAAGHAALGSTLMALGRTEEAIAALRRAIELAPQAADLHNQLGVALYQTGDLEGTEAAFRQAQQADPKDVQPLLNLIELYRSQERYVEATEAVKQALVLDANHPDVLLAFGTLSLELGDVEGAQMALRRLQTLQPDYPCPLALREVLGQPNKNRQKMATTNAPISA